MTAGLIVLSTGRRLMVVAIEQFNAIATGPEYYRSEGRKQMKRV